MLQRVQSIFMLLSAFAMAIFVGVNTFYLSTPNGDEIIANAFQILEKKGSQVVYQKQIFYVAVLAIMSIVLSLFNIFQYKNRLRQMMFVSLDSILIMASVGILLYHIKTGVAKEANFVLQDHLSYGFWASIVALACNFIANRFIRKDEKLVQSSERMR